MLVSIIIQSILIFLTVVIALLLYALPSGKKKQNLPLCFFLFITALHSIIDLTVDSPLFGSLKIHLLAGTFIFLYAPLLYFHYCGLYNKPREKIGFHFIMFAAFFAYAILWGFSHNLFFFAFSAQYLFYTLWISRLVKMNPNEKVVKK